MKSTNIQNKILEKYKIDLFNRLIQIIWNDNLDEIDNLPKEFQNINNHEQFNEEIIVNLIRVIMGLDPLKNPNRKLKDMVNEALDLGCFCEPIIPIIENACMYCDENNKNETCFIRDKHINCNDKKVCSACGSCISKCKLGAISDKVQFIPMINILKNKKIPTYAVIAPSFIGQFGNEITPGKLRSAFKQIGFEDMIEVSLAADILTAKEAYEYSNHMDNNKYFMTSCCCPVWLSLIKNKFPEILDNVSPSVSPMIACGRLIKMVEPNAKVVFIGPCTAKKKEATLEDVADAVDFVLTYQEVDIIFKSLKLDLVSMDDDERFEASYSGRIYGRNGGVSEAIEINAKTINPDVVFKSIAFQGIDECSKGLEGIRDNEGIDATFIEGMGCIGGCVGGPKKIISTEEGKKYINKYSESTSIKTPFDNINVARMLGVMGNRRISNLGDIDKDMVLRMFSRNMK